MMEQAASFSYFYGKVNYKYTCYVLHTVNTVQWKDSPVEPRSSSIFFSTVICHAHKIKQYVHIN